MNGCLHFQLLAAFGGDGNGHIVGTAGGGGAHQTQVGAGKIQLHTGDTAAGDAGAGDLVGGIIVNDEIAEFPLLAGETQLQIRGHGGKGQRAEAQGQQQDKGNTSSDSFHGKSPPFLRKPAGPV